MPLMAGGYLGHNNDEMIESRNVVRTTSLDFHREGFGLVDRVFWEALQRRY